MKAKTTWPKKPYRWEVDDTLFISVPFTWNLPALRVELMTGNLMARRIIVGGPAVKLMPEYLADVATIGGDDLSALRRVNPQATRTTVGCPNHCGFCAVPRISGEFRELDTWEPAPIVCDDNLLACARAHFDKVIDSLKQIKGVDFNQGLDARLMTTYHAGRLAELDAMIRVSWDSKSCELPVRRALEYLTSAGIPTSRIRCYVLVGWRDTPEDVLYRCETLTGLGVRPNVQRYEPLDALAKGQYIGENWTGKLLRDFCRYWNRQAWLGGIPFADYHAGYRQRQDAPLFATAGEGLDKGGGSV